MSIPSQETIRSAGARLCKRCSVLRFNDELLTPCLTETKSSPSCLSIESERIFPLEYHLFYSLPDLPCLETGADTGCDFCHILRGEIIRAGFDYRGRISIKLVYHWGNDYFEDLGLAALVAELRWESRTPPTSDRGGVLRNSIIFTLESNDGQFLLYTCLVSILG
jgi:hypothetical protein